MKIQFNSNLDYQKEAVDAIVDIFKGKEKFVSKFTVYTAESLSKRESIEFYGYTLKETLG
jgi:type III restriction enzyme